MYPPFLPRVTPRLRLRALVIMRTARQDEDNAPAVSSSASVVGAGAGGGWKNSTDNMGDAHGGVSPGADDNAMPDFNSGGNGFGGGGGSGSELMANTGVRLNGPSLSSAAAVDGRMAGSKLMTGLIGRVEAKVEAVGLPVLHLRYGTIEYTVSVPLTLQIGTWSVLSRLVDNQGMSQ